MELIEFSLSSSDYGTHYRAVKSDLLTGGKTVYFRESSRTGVHLYACGPQFFQFSPRPASTVTKLNFADYRECSDCHQLTSVYFMRGSTCEPCSKVREMLNSDMRIFHTIADQPFLFTPTDGMRATPENVISAKPQFVISNCIRAGYRVISNKPLNEPLVPRDMLYGIVVKKTRGCSFSSVHADTVEPISQYTTEAQRASVSPLRLMAFVAWSRAKHTELAPITSTHLDYVAADKKVYLRTMRSQHVIAYIDPEYDSYFGETFFP